MRPLLMVHGIVGSAQEAYGVPGRWLQTPHSKGMCRFLEHYGYSPGKDLFWYTYPTLKPIPVSAQRLQKEINRALALSGSREIDVLTFSLGGIIGKYYTVSPLYQQEIRRMIMIAPPFLGSHWADWFFSGFTRSAQDLLFPGDGRALSPQVLGFENLFLQQLAASSFPAEVETTVIAARATVGNQNKPLTNYLRWLINWTGEGDLVVPVESTQVPVDHFFEVREDFSLRNIHRFLPYHPEVQRLVGKQLGLDI